MGTFWNPVRIKDMTHKQKKEITMKNKKDISVRMFKWWWNIDDLDVEKIIGHYTRLLNFIKDNNSEDAKSYADNISDDIRQYEKTWNDTGKEW